MEKAFNTLRQNWSTEEIKDLFNLPFIDLLLKAQHVHRAHFVNNNVQLSTLLSIKTGACPENCAYCPQSAHYQTNIDKHQLLDIETVKDAAALAKEKGATRFCMGAAWRSPPQKVFVQLLAILKAVKALDLETCMTLGMLTSEQAKALAEEGLDYYNHNLDTSSEYYTKIITTRTYEDRLRTLEYVRSAGIKVCCGGIVGMGESREDRIRFLQQLSNLPMHPESIPINHLIPVPGTPLAHAEKLDSFEFIRVIAVARILMPKSVIRLSAGRENMNEELQALCFIAGANSVFYGEKLLTTKNSSLNQDDSLLQRLGLRASHPGVKENKCSN